MGTYEYVVRALFGNCIGQVTRAKLGFKKCQPE